MDRIWQIWLSGGWVMIPQFLLAVLLYTQAFQLLMFVRRNDISASKEAHWWEWVRHPERAEGRVARIIRFTQTGVVTADHVRSRFEEVRLAISGLVDRSARFIGTLVAAAPLLGLLGTVLGMLQTFFGISTSGGSETAGVVAAGISEALVTTQTGLSVALPGLFIVMVIRRRKYAFEAKLARLESLTLSGLKVE
jgi:biopolymer transport protein ExbB